MKINKSNSKQSASNNKHLELSHKEHLIQLDATQKYQKFKKSASLPNYYLNKARLKKITQIYRTLSSDKLNVHSMSKSRRNSPINTFQKRSSLHHTPFASININTYLESQVKGKKLTLGRNNQNQNISSSQHQPNSQNSSYIQMNVKLRCIIDKLQEILTSKSDEIFSRDIRRYCEYLTGSQTERKTGKQTPQSQKEYLNLCFNILDQCFTRRQQIRLNDLKQNYSKVQEQLGSLQIQLKKKSIRSILDQKNLEKEQLKNKQLQKTIDELTAKLRKNVASIGVNTDFKETTFTKTNDSNQTDNFFINTQFLSPTENSAFYKKNEEKGKNLNESQSSKLIQCMKKLQSYSKRQKQLLSVLVVLRNQGIDVERVYEDVVSGKVDISDEESDKMIESTQYLRQQENNMYRKYRNLNNGNSFDADNSIISSADGLSFNYDERSLEDEAYTIRHEYKCKKDLGEQMRNRLKLNLNVLYDEQDIYDDDYQSQQSVPTI